MTKTNTISMRKIGRRQVLQMGGAGFAALALPLAAPAQDPVKLTVWAWLPDMQLQIDMFTAANPGIEVELVNAGQGGPQYTAMRAGLQAGAGLPDIAQVEFQMLQSFRLVDALADIGATANPFKDEFAGSIWSQISEGDAVYAMPQDSGPMAMLVRQDIFDEYGITAPTTWDEFATAARALHAANPEIYVTNATFNDGEQAQIALHIGHGAAVAVELNFIACRLSLEQLAILGSREEVTEALMR